MDFKFYGPVSANETNVYQKALWDNYFSTYVFKEPILNLQYLLNGYGLAKACAKTKNPQLCHLSNAYLREIWNEKRVIYTDSVVFRTNFEPIPLEEFEWGLQEGIYEEAERTAYVDGYYEVDFQKGSTDDYHFLRPFNNEDREKLYGKFLTGVAAFEWLISELNDEELNSFAYFKEFSVPYADYSDEDIEYLLDRDSQLRFECSLLDRSLRLPSPKILIDDIKKNMAHTIECCVATLYFYS